MPVDMEKIRQKLQFIRQNLRELQQFAEMDLEEFENNSLYEAAATRMLQIAIEALLDICTHIIAREGWGLPKTYVESIEMAAYYGLIPKEFLGTYKAMARFRNRVVHMYDDIEVGEIHKIIINHLDDFQPFMENVIKKYLKA